MSDLTLPTTTIPLSGTLALPDGGEAPAFLCLTDGGIFLTTAHHSDATIDLGTLSADVLSYVSRPLGDRLVVQGQRFSVPFGKAAVVREAIAAARIRAAAPHPDGNTTAFEGPFTDECTPLESAWLACTVPDEEPVIAWMATQSSHTFERSIGGRRVSGGLRLLLTADRALLVAVSAYGEAHTQPLPPGPIVISDNRITRDTAEVGDVQWRLPMNGAERLRPLLRLPALPRPQRLREAARVLALDPDPKADAHATRLMEAIHSADPLDRLAHFQLTGEAREDDLREALRALAAQDTDAGRLADWARRWGLPLPKTRRLLAAAMAVLEPEQAPWALPLHRHVREQQLSLSSDLFEQAAVDMELSAHLLVAGRKAEARSILEPRRSKLPNEDLLAVLPPPEADLTSGEGGQPMHIQVLELLAAARSTKEEPDSAALAELARNQPLLKRRLRALSRVRQADLAARAAGALAALEPGGVAPQDAEPPPTTRGLDAERLALLQHPVTRDNGMFSQLQSALAKVTPPDHSSVRDYCEKVSPRRNRAVTEAIADACVALGMPAVPAFISMGDKRIGVRSHEVPEPFLLIGGAHLDPEDDAYLRPIELRAAIGAEIAHIRFKHSRITSSDLWAGVWDKGTAALETTAVLLPFMKFIPVDLIGKQRTYEMVSRVLPLTWLQQIYDSDDIATLADAVVGDIGKIGSAAGSAVGDVSGKISTVGDAANKLLPTRAPPAQDVSLDGARVLAAHRVMQLTADRAALVLSGDLPATVRAMFLVHSRLLPELAVAERAGLHGCLARRGEDGLPVLPDLTVRIAALVAFYLSEDYTALRAHLRPAALEAEE